MATSCCELAKCQRASFSEHFKCSAITMMYFLFNLASALHHKFDFEVRSMVADEASMRSAARKNDSAKGVKHQIQRSM
jgi:hypothetical protein